MTAVSIALTQAEAEADTKPTLREIVLDALTDAFYGRRAEIEGCRDCGRNPAGICGDHQDDNEAAADYEAARKQIEHGSDETFAETLLAATRMTQMTGGLP